MTALAQRPSIPVSSTSYGTAPGIWHPATSAVALRPGKPLKVAWSRTTIVLYRKADGQPVAMDNRCPHRWAPLSDGRIQGDNIICPLHGFAFCPRGHLVDPPGKPPNPGVGTAQTYPTQERDGQVWIRIDSSKI